jgi:glycosyltransferase involved in cell wall biosynthesis
MRCCKKVIPVDHKKLKVLVISPNTTGGSWRQLEITLSELVKICPIQLFLCVGDKTGIKDEFIKCHSQKIEIKFVNPLNYFKYYVRFPLVSIFYFSFLGFVSLIVSLFFMPDIIISNGIVQLFYIVPYKVVSKRTTIILEFHGELKDYVPKYFLKVVHLIINSLVDLGIVNSSDSFIDLSSIVDQRKIIIRQISTDKNYFVQSNSILLRKKYGFNEDDFILLFVGYLNYEKTFDIFLSVALKLIDEKIPIKILVIGDGPMRDRVIYFSQKHENIIYRGFVSDPSVLHEFYSIADITWAYADETYLAVPAIESLASGTPILVPDVPAISRKRIKGVRISSALFPNSVGFVVRHDNLNEIVNKIVFLHKNRVLLKNMRKNAYLYALEEYSMRNHRVTAFLIIYYYAYKNNFL